VGYLVFLYLLKLQPATQLIDIVNHENAFTERNRKGEGERERERENLFFFFFCQSWPNLNMDRFLQRKSEETDGFPFVPNLI
jgi:hypothetical protein